MRRFFKYTQLSVYCIIYGCTTSTTNTNTAFTDDTTDADTATYTVAVDSSRPATPAIPLPEGVYRGYLPGGLQHTVLFHKNDTYILEEVVAGKRGATPFRVSGTWRPSNNLIWLYNEGVVQARYAWQGDTLMYLNTKTNKRYALQKGVSATDNDVWKAKGAAGLEFYGVGNEPFWNIEIDEQKAIRFHLADWGGPVAFKPSKPVAAGDSTVYNTANDSATLRVIIHNTFCSDGMSDFIYNNSVTVQYNGQTFRGCGIRY